MSNLLVETRYGKIQGTTDGPVSVWKGIPYAQPPLGPLRFRSPQPLQPWTGVRETTAFSPIAPQDTSGFGTMSGGSATAEIISEDCLYLNIWSPAADDQKRPVMVWLHGGAFSLGSGSSPSYKGVSFATHGDLVVVTLNYRLGALGFLYLGDLSETYISSGNNGLLDQVAALQWVRDNIAAFGGDPEQVTVFGESAGAMSIGLLLGMPAARGLFQRAILESGAAHTIADIPKAIAIRGDFFQALQLPDNTIETLVAQPLDTLLAAQKTLSQKYGIVAFQPVSDTATFPQPPLTAIEHAGGEAVVTLIGTNRDEMKLFTMMGFNREPPAGAMVRLHDYATALGLSEQEAWLAFLTDKSFRQPAIQLADILAQRGAHIWMYRFDWATPAFGGILGACHALELPFVWDYLVGSELSIFLGGELTPAMQKLADQMHTAWIAFARTGNPNITDLPTWPPYETEQRATMLFAETCQVVNDPQAIERQLWSTFP